jgi:demethylmenaquinone methyltransferase/2-methoxy-6-polyprenyl-1,4-benzoquinol methylase/phosphoethanolamine N-methyltransferase
MQFIHKMHEKAHGEAASVEAPETTGATIRWWAPAYDAVAWLTSMGQEKAIRKQALKVAGLKPGEKVLDVGSGTGTLGVAAWRKVRPDGEVTGIDASPEMVELARRKAAKKGSGAKFEVAPIEALPFGDSSLDVVLSTFMLHHLPEEVKAKGFAEIQRVLKPGGRFVAVDLGGEGRSVLTTFMAVIGHKMPKDYAEQLMARMTVAGLAEATQVKTKFGYLAFLTAKKA